jgi:uncharacterized protein YdaU (DUF1376 family)
MHYFQFNIGDYESHTKHLTPIEDICYRRLLDYYYLHELPIQNDIDKISRLLMLNEYSTTVERVLNEFFTLDETVWINKRADEEINAYYGKKKQASNAGKASAALRKQRSLNGRSISVEPNIKQEPLNINHKPAVERASRLPKNWQLPQDYLDFCLKERPELDAVQVSLSFKDFWIAKAGKDGAKLDWFATWRNWVRNQKSNGINKPMKGHGVISDADFKQWLEPEGILK